MINDFNLKSLGKKELIVHLSGISFRGKIETFDNTTLHLSKTYTSLTENPKDKIILINRDSIIAIEEA